jgi:hypothetical protein
LEAANATICLVNCKYLQRKVAKILMTTFALCSACQLFMPPMKLLDGIPNIVSGMITNSKRAYQSKFNLITSCAKKSCHQFVTTTFGISFEILRFCCTKRGVEFLRVNRR